MSPANSKSNDTKLDPSVRVQLSLTSIHMPKARHWATTCGCGWISRLVMVALTPTLR